MWILDIEVVANSSSISGDVMLMMDEETLTYLMFVLESYRICRWKNKQGMQTIEYSSKRKGEEVQPQ